MSGIADAESIEKSSVSDRISFMMRTSGIAITITSITDFLAFSIGASSVFISVRNFCIYTGNLLLFNELLKTRFSSGTFKLIIGVLFHVGKAEALSRVFP